MPIHVTIKINDHLLHEVHIGRIAGDTNPNSKNVYVAVIGEEPLRLENWKERGVLFNHRYGDGADVCVRKALKALEKQKKGEMSKWV